LSCIEDPFGHVTYGKDKIIWVKIKSKDPPRPHHDVNINSSYTHGQVGLKDVVWLSGRPI